MGLMDLRAEQKTADKLKTKGGEPQCGKCSACGEKMDYAGFGYCQCMNPTCERMGVKVKAT